MRPYYIMFEANFYTQKRSNIHGLFLLDNHFQYDKIFKEDKDSEMEYYEVKSTLDKIVD